MLNTLAAAGAIALAAPLALAGPAHADPPTNIIVGTFGDDRLFGTNKSDFILGFPGDDWMRGGRKADAMFGGYGRDVIRAAGRHSGTDLVRGGPGFDRCVVDQTDRAIGCNRLIVRTF